MTIDFIGGDKRMNYAAARLSEKYNSDGEKSGRKVIVLPLPLSKDGKTVFAPESTPIPFEELYTLADCDTLVLAGGESPRLTEICTEIGCTLCNYFADEALTLGNAALTAEAAMCLLSQSGDGALLNSKALILGSGRIAVFLARRLKACGTDVTLAARNKDKRALLKLEGFSAVPIEELDTEDYDYIANTIPADVFPDEKFGEMKSGAVFMELASLPDRSAAAERYKIKYIFAGGLPGKYSPKAAGELIADTICNIIEIYRKE